MGPFTQYIRSRVITHLAGLDGKQGRWGWRQENQRDYIIQKPNMPLFGSFQGTAASFAIQIGVFSITLEPVLPSPCLAFSQAFSVNSSRERIRDERAGDALAISLGPRDPKRIGRAEKPRQEPRHNGHLGDRRKWPL